MLMQRAITLSLLLIFVLEAFAELALLKSETLKVSDTWFLFVLVIIGSASLFLGKGQRSTPVLCLLLASMAVLVSGADPNELSTEWIQVLGPATEALPRFVWGALRWLGGFAFVHFALIFPIEERFLRRRPALVLIVYVPYLLLLGLEHLVSATAGLGLLSMLSCLLFGLVILIRKYKFSMTPAEKNRLRVVLIGCLAGALPAALATLSAILMEDQASSAQDVGLFMFPLFPLGLVGAGLVENFSEIGKWLQRTLTYSLAAAGSVTAFFLCYWTIGPFLGGGAAKSPMNPLVLATTLALAFTYPFIRWSGAYISAHFNTRDEPEPSPEASRPPFQPIEPNPYIVGNPVRSPEMFFGREEDFQFIRTKLSSEQQGCVIVLCGERRTGKTSILYQILNGRLGPHFLPVFIDMQGMIVQRDSEFLDELASRIREAISTHAGSNGGSLPSVISNYFDFNRFLDAVTDSTGGRRLVLLIDEYELIETKVKDAKLGAEIFSYFNSLLLRYPRLSFVFTGSRDLQVSGAWTALLERSIYRKISFLARKDAQELVCAPLQDKVFFAPARVNDLLRLTHGHPFFTQAVCQTLVDVLNEVQSNVVDRKSLDETMRRVLENPPPQLFYQWKTFTDAEKLVLSALATLLKKPQGYLSSDRVEKLVRSLPGESLHHLEASIIRMHFEKLRERSFLDRDQTRYRFTMDLMRLWVQSEHNVWKVLSEVSSRQAGQASFLAN